MRGISLILTFAAVIPISGCRTAQQPSSSPAALQSRSLAEMEAEYATMRAKYVKDCIEGSPEHVRNNQPVCNQEREAMAPLGNAVIKAEQEAVAQKKTP